VKVEEALNADGMSAADVEDRSAAPGTYFVGFAGMVMRGGNPSDYLYFMTAHFLMQMVFEIL
jgi:hypothetical protein